MRIWLFLLTLPLLLSCHHGRLEIGFHGSDEGYVQALVAAQYWNEACQEDLVEVHQGDGALNMQEQDSPCGTSNQAGVETDYDYVVSSWQTICVERKPGEVATDAHEMGHALGLHHPQTDDGTIMVSGAQLRNSEGDYTIKPGLISAGQCGIARY